MELRLMVEGASPDEIKRGLEAAMKVFNDAGIQPVEAAEGMLAFEGWDEAGFPHKGEEVLGEENRSAANVWIQAQEAAIAACCADWPEDRNRTGVLEVVSTESEAMQCHGD